MARACDYCEKGPAYGNKVSHSNIKTRTRWMPNIKKMKAVVKGTTVTVRACTRCIRSGKVVRPVKRTFAYKTATTSAA
jgi:large subunit ribosomal protein L28